MREKVIKNVILSIVFICALFVSSFIINDGNTGMTADMNAAVFPTISFETEGYNVNLLAGHKNEMDIPAIRDTITPISSKGTISVNIQTYDQKINSLTYQVFSLDGEKELLNEEINDVEDVEELDIGNALKKRAEGVLKITLSLSDEQPIYYYTRITESDALNIKECLAHVENLYTNMFENRNSDDVKRSMEESSAGSNSTLQHVDIHSNLEHSMWGELSPELVSEVQYSIKETKEAYTSVLLTYRVKCKGDNNEEELHRVKEFFKVSHSGERSYLLDYDRTVEEIFDGSKVVLMSKGINLGLTPEDISYKANQDGTIVSFVQSDELWSYNKQEDEFALVFSFADSEKEDIRNYNDNHSIRILSMEENGNITFGVYGYMNRGVHEGESGVAIYYFNMAQNSVEEKAFIPSTQSQLIIEEKIGELAYFSNEMNVLYVLMDGTLNKIDLRTNKKEAILDDLREGSYISSNDGQFLAYLKNEDATEIEVLNFKDNNSKSVKAEDGEILQPLGFILEDFVYGISKPEYEGKDSSGEKVIGMHRIEIRDSANNVVKTYQVEDSYVIDVEIKGNMITLERAVKRGNLYEGITEDYITNNEETTNSVELKSYWTDLKETQFRLVFADGIDNKKAKVLKPKQVLFEQESSIEFADVFEENLYRVYGFGELVGVYSEAGDAILKAEEVSGVVISPEQHYVWEDGNRVSWYRNFEMKAFTVKNSESTLAASIRAVLSYEGESANVVSELKEKTAYEVLRDNLGEEVVRIQENSVANMRYLIDKGTPVIAMTGNNKAIVLIGFDAKTVTYIDPSNGSIRNKSFEDVDDMMEASGNVFLGYVK